MNFIIEHALTILSFLLTLVFVSFVLRAKKPSGSMVAWLLLILAAPYLGIPLYLMFSGRKLPTRLNQKVIARAKAAVETSSATVNGIQRILLVSGAPSAKANESIELLQNGEIAFARYLELVRNAKKSVHVTTFIFGNDEVGRALLAALAERAAAGLDVRVIVDSFGGTLIRHPSLLEFKQAKGLVAYFMPLLHVPFRGRSNLRNHRKLLVVDNEVAILGGMNLAEEYMGPRPDPRRWTDLAIAVRGASVADLQNVFLQDWAFASHATQLEEAAPIAESPAGLSAQVAATGPDVPGDPLYDVLLNSIYSAKSEILIVTPYFIPDESLAKALELASKRGVKVHVLLPRKSNHALADIARGSFIRQLQAVAVEFHFFRSMIHAKAVLIDDQIGVVGSANFDMRSLLLNYELGLVIYDRETIAKVRAWAAVCLRNSDPEFSQETLGRDLIEGIGRIVGPFI